MPEQPANSDKNEREDTPSNRSSNESTQQQQSEPVIREITQTDQLNKRLLSSLLERMNNGDERVNKFLESNSSEDHDHESEF